MLKLINNIFPPTMKIPEPLDPFEQYQECIKMLSGVNLGNHTDEEKYELLRNKERPSYMNNNYASEIENLKIKIEKTIRETLKGIDTDECESGEGWWETSTGAEFGKNKLNELIDNINKILEKSI